MTKRQARTVQEPRMSDAAVKAKTGKTWSQWFTILDEAGAEKMSHKQIVAFLSAGYRVGSWWQQMVTVTYEQARGMREKHENTEGYQVSVSRTLSAPVATVYRAWHDARSRNRWLGEKGITIRKATPEKSIRITWVDGRTSIEVNFYSKGEDKSQVVVQHSKLPNAKEASARKEYWSEKLDALKSVLVK